MPQGLEQFKIGLDRRIAEASHSKFNSLFLVFNTFHTTREVLGVGGDVTFYLFSVFCTRARWTNAWFRLDTPVPNFDSNCQQV